MQALILAGGFGTRLKTVVSEVPKPLAPIANKPFLFWLITYLQQQGVTNFIFSLGYLHQQVESFLKEEFLNSLKNYQMIFLQTFYFLLLLDYEFRLYHLKLLINH